MPCQYCNEHWFWKKVGRCQRCMKQLICLSIFSWLAWWYAGASNPKSIESVTILVAGFGFHALLFLHLWMRFVVFPWRRKKIKS
ncbi:DUF3624 domain-containing protein [Vibrio zhanjiangensis]|uniref:DUF3624 domain-containing protein n=1 Tax=Vibrio zhanjiangensis TaxID=1046128 RepID=UPI0024E16E46|nr:DUF3624 domain-containing protein [Vibrio zhanjiangensis]